MTIKTTIKSANKIISNRKGDFTATNDRNNQQIWNL